MPKLTREQFKKVREALCPRGCCKDKVADEDAWFLGWLGYGRGYLSHPIGLKLGDDGSCIVITIWPRNAYCNIGEVVAFICGVMSQVMPDMKLDKWPERECRTVAFVFREEISVELKRMKHYEDLHHLNKLRNVSEE